MSKSARLVFFGTEDFSAVTLQRLIDDNWNVVGVVTKPDFKAGRGQKLAAPAVKTLAVRHGIEVLQPANLHKSVYEIAMLDGEFGILSAYGKLVPGSVIDIFPGGIINVHPSLLPRYRGASPIEAAILNGDHKTGISLMQLSLGMDEGPVYAQKEVILSGEETKPEFYEELARTGADFLVQVLPDIISGEVIAKPQDDSRATYAPLLKKSDGRIDWSKPAEVYEREVRAYLGYPKSTAKIHGQEVIITKARLAKNTNDGKLVVDCNPGYLEILELIGPSGKTMSGEDFLRGLRK